MAGAALILSPREHALEAPLVTARGRYSVRRTLQLTLRDANGVEGHGEAAPLPGYSIDDLETCEQSLRAIPEPALVALMTVTDMGALLAGVAALLPERTPAARFALETALLDRWARTSQRPLWSWIARYLGSRSGDTGPRPVPLCALVPSHEGAQAAENARRSFALGVRAFKLKIGPVTLSASQRDAVAAVRVLGDEVVIRLDANQSLEPERAAETARLLAPFTPEFVEEPFPAQALPALERFGCGWALDESLQDMSAATLSRHLALPSCRALVLKPTALGGIARCLELASAARERGREVVVSHTLEGPVGWRACAQLALGLGHTAAAGLWPLPHQNPLLASIEDGHLLPEDGCDTPWGSP